MIFHALLNWIMMMSFFPQNYLELTRYRRTFAAIFLLTSLNTHIMIKKSYIVVLAFLALTTTMNAEPIEIPFSPVPTTPDNGDHPRSPMLTPVFYLDGYTLTASSNTVGSTVELKDETGTVVFSTYIYIEGDINLPTTLSGTYTIEVTRGGITFQGEIELE